MVYDIEKVLILNLKKRPDRFWTCYGALMATGTPMDRVMRVEASPGIDFKDKDALVRAATEDGFPEFERIVRELPADDPNYQLELNIKSQAWDYCRMLRYLKDTNQSGLILYDDRYVKKLGESRIFIQESSEIAVSERYLYLAVRLLLFCEFESKNETYNVAIFPISNRVRGVAVRMRCFIPAAGAEWFLEKILEEENECRNVESTINRLSFIPARERPDFWSCEISFISNLQKLTGSNIGNLDTGVFPVPTIT